MPERPPALDAIASLMLAMTVGLLRLYPEYGSLICSLRCPTKLSAIGLMEIQQRVKPVFFVILFICGTSLFLRYANLQLAADDIAWLGGETPTVFDQYRIVPRLFFETLRLLFGESAAAALSMVFFFHTVDGNRICS